MTKYVAGYKQNRIVVDYDELWTGAVIHVDGRKVASQRVFATSANGRFSDSDDIVNSISARGFRLGTRCEIKVNGCPLDSERLGSSMREARIDLMFGMVYIGGAVLLTMTTGLGATTFLYLGLCGLVALLRAGLTFSDKMRSRRSGDALSAP